MVFDCVRGQGPGYFDDVLVPVHTIGARARLGYADHGDTVVPRSCRPYCTFQSAQLPLERPSVRTEEL